jgi:hypothetical protein
MACVARPVALLEEEGAYPSFRMSRNKSSRFKINGGWAMRKYAPTRQSPSGVRRPRQVSWVIADINMETGEKTLEPRVAHFVACRTKQLNAPAKTRERHRERDQKRTVFEEEPSEDLAPEMCGYDLTAWDEADYWEYVYTSRATDSDDDFDDDSDDDVEFDGW